MSIWQERSLHQSPNDTQLCLWIITFLAPKSSTAGSDRHTMDCHDQWTQSSRILQQSDLSVSQRKDIIDKALENVETSDFFNKILPHCTDA